MDYIKLDLTKENLNSIKINDFVKCNDWKKPLRVRGVSDNFFLMATNRFGKVLYSVCEKRLSKYSHNYRNKDQFTIGTDYWLFGYGCDSYQVDNPKWVNEYLNSWESGETQFSRTAISLNSILIKR